MSDFLLRVYESNSAELMFLLTPDSRILDSKRNDITADAVALKETLIRTAKKLEESYKDYREINHKLAMLHHYLGWADKDLGRFEHWFKSKEKEYA